MGWRARFARRKAVDMLRIYKLVLEVLGQCQPVLRRIELKDRDLARQLRKALSSVPLNVAEASDQRGKKRGSHYSIALGSAREAWSALLAAEAWGYVDAPSPDLKARFDHVIGTLHRVAHPR